MFIDTLIIIVYILFILMIITLLVRWISNKNKIIEEKFDLLYTSYPKGFVSTDLLDYMPKHARISHAGGVMYVSNKPPTEPLYNKYNEYNDKKYNYCKTVNCPSYLVDDYTPGNMFYPNKNITCWTCD